METEENKYGLHLQSSNPTLSPQQFGFLNTKEYFNNTLSNYPSDYKLYDDMQKLDHHLTLQQLNSQTGKIPNENLFQLKLQQKLLQINENERLQLTNERNLYQQYNAGASLCPQKIKKVSPLGKKQRSFNTKLSHSPLLGLSSLQEVKTINAIDQKGTCISPLLLSNQYGKLTSIQIEQIDPYKNGSISHNFFQGFQPKFSKVDEIDQTLSRESGISNLLRYNNFTASQAPNYVPQNQRLSSGFQQCIDDLGQGDNFSCPCAPIQQQFIGIEKNQSANFKNSNLLSSLSSKIIGQQQKKKSGSPQNQRDQLSSTHSDDQFLKSIVNHIPYGVAVLDLKNIVRYNTAFAKSLGFQRSCEILMALNRFKRKSKSKMAQRLYPGINSESQSNDTRKGQTDLRNDIINILQNVQTLFKDKAYIFETYHIEREDQEMSVNGTSQHSISPTISQNLKRSQFSSKPSIRAKKFYNVSLSPIIFSESQCLLLTVNDVTTQKIVDQKDVIDKLKNMIFKSYTHELKTPLNGICLSLETSQHIAKQLDNSLKKINMGSNNAFDEQLYYSKVLIKHLKVINSCSIMLKSTMHDFFDYNQLQSGELSLVPREFNLRDFVKEIAETVRQQLQSKDVKFSCKIDVIDFINDQNLAENQQIKMLADKDRLQQILLNLLSNSIKFTPTGQIKLLIQIFRKKNSPYQMQVKFKVVDTGIGIDNSRIHKIFNLFEKTQSSNINTYLNDKQKCNVNLNQQEFIYLYQNNIAARMGLPISQNLCQFMGGFITVESVEGEGSVFKFTLPLVYTNKNKSSNRTVDLATSQILKTNNNSLTELNKVTQSNVTNNNEMIDTLSGPVSDVDGNYYNLETSESHSTNINQNFRTREQAIQQHLKQQIFIEQRKHILGQFEMVFSNEESQQQSLNQELDFLPPPMNENFHNIINSFEALPDINKFYIPEHDNFQSATHSQNNQHWQRQFSDENKGLDYQRYQVERQNSNSQNKNFRQGMIHPSTSSNQTFGMPKIRRQSSEMELVMVEQRGHIKPKNLQKQFSEKCSERNKFPSKEYIRYSTPGAKDEQLQEHKQLYSAVSDHQKKISHDIQILFKDIHKQEELNNNSTIQFESPSNKKALQQNNSIQQSYAILLSQPQQYSEQTSKNQQDQKSRPNIEKIDCRIQEDARSKILQNAGEIKISPLSIKKNNEFTLQQEQKNQMAQQQLTDEFEVLDTNRTLQISLPSQTDVQPGRNLFIDKKANTIAYSKNHQRLNQKVKVPQFESSYSEQKTNTNAIQNQLMKQSMRNQIQIIDNLSDDSPQMTTGINQQFTFEEFSQSNQNQQNQFNLKYNNHSNITSDINEEVKRQFSNSSSNTLTVNYKNKSKSKALSKSGADEESYSNDFLQVKEIKPNYRAYQSTQEHLAAEKQSQALFDELERNLFGQENNVDPSENEDLLNSNNSVNRSQTIQKNLSQFNEELVLPSQVSGISSQLPDANKNLIQFDGDGIIHSKTNGPELRQFQKLANFSHLKSSIISKDSISHALSLARSIPDVDITSGPKQCCPQVMIVDDVQMNRYALNSILGFMYNLKCLEVTNGQECVDKLISFYQNKKCDCDGIKVIFMDIEMPVMDGIQATILIKKMVAKNEIPDIPIVGLTAYLDERKNGMNSGMKEFMVKPASANSLKEVLKSLGILKSN